MEPVMTFTCNATTEKMKLYMVMELSQQEWKLGFSMEGVPLPRGAETADGGMTPPRPGLS